MILSGAVYIVKCSNGRYYTGSTNDFKRRYMEHLSGQVKATRNLLPLEIKFVKKFETLSGARRIERKIKKLKRRDLIERIIKSQQILME